MSNSKGLIKYIMRYLSHGHCNEKSKLMMWEMVLNICLNIFKGYKILASGGEKKVYMHWKKQ